MRLLLTRCLTKSHSNLLCKQIRRVIFRGETRFLKHISEDNQSGALVYNHGATTIMNAR